MKVETDRFGELDVPDDRVLTCPDGLPGFPDAHRFALVDVRDASEDAVGVFYWVQSIDDPSLAFLSAVPWPFFPTYEPELGEDDQELLGIEQVEDALVLCLLTVKRDEGVVTANLLGPLVINQRNRTARQVVLVDSEYETQVPLPAA